MGGILNDCIFKKIIKLLQFKTFNEIPMAGFSTFGELTFGLNINQNINSLFFFYKEMKMIFMMNMLIILFINIQNFVHIYLKRN